MEILSFQPFQAFKKFWNELWVFSHLSTRKYFIVSYYSHVSMGKNIGLKILSFWKIDHRIIFDWNFGFFDQLKEYLCDNFEFSKIRGIRNFDTFSTIWLLKKCWIDYFKFSTIRVFDFFKSSMNVGLKFFNPRHLEFSTIRAFVEHWKGRYENL